MRGYYRDEFEDFHNQAILMFPDMDFSQIHMKLGASMTYATDPIPNDEETEDEMLVTDGPIDEANDPKGPNDQPTHTLAYLGKKLFFVLFFWFFGL